MTQGVAGKSTHQELAIFTGRPTFPKPLHVGTPNVGARAAFLERTTDILERRWLSNDGPYVQEFESRIAELVEVEHCVAICNGTVALELAASAAGLGGEVIVPSFTFVATVHALRWLGLTPIFCDIDPQTHNLDPAHAAELITERTSAIVGVHVWGRPAYRDELDELARSHGLKLLFDAAHAVGCSVGGRPIGGRGDAEILSFHATKIVNTFEGGAVLTNDEQLALKIRKLRNFGFSSYDNVAGLGVNGKLSEIGAAMGLGTLEQLDASIAANRRNYERYRSSLEEVQGVHLVTYDEDEAQSYQHVVLELDAGACLLPRDELLRVLHAENVLARRYFYPGCHRMEPYRTLDPDLKLPATEAVAARVLSLPTGTTITENDVGTICKLIRLAIENADVVKQS
jgi:dTDP-4-amino-4,6-dideoxygalactose transaminase